MAFQDWLGQEGYIEYVQDHWIALPWWLGLIFASMFLYLATYVERKVEEEWKRLQMVKHEAILLMEKLEDVGEATAWEDKSQTDRVYAWYEFDGLRKALGEEDNERS